MTLGHTIPSAFLPFDATMTDPDKPVNVRDRVTLSRNLNILMARRLRQPILTLATLEDNDTPGAFPFDGGFRVLDEGVALRRFVLRCQVFLPPLAQTCTLNCYCYQTSNTAPDDDVDVILYASLDTGDDQTSLGVMADTAATVNVVAAGITKVALTVNCPAQHDESTPVFFSLYAETPHKDTDVKGGGHAAIIAAGADWVDVNENWPTGNIVYIMTSASAVRTECHPRQIVKRDDLSTGGYRYWVDGVWGASINAGSDLADSRPINNLHLRSLTLYANAVTDATAVVDR